MENLKCPLAQVSRSRIFPVSTPVFLTEIHVFQQSQTLFSVDCASLNICNSFSLSYLQYFVKVENTIFTRLVISKRISVLTPSPRMDDSKFLHIVNKISMQLKLSTAAEARAKANPSCHEKIKPQRFC